MTEQIVDLRFATDAMRTEVASFGAMIACSEAAKKQLSTKSGQAMTRNDTLLSEASRHNALYDILQAEAIDPATITVKQKMEELGLTKPFGQTALAHLHTEDSLVPPESATIFDSYQEVAKEIQAFVIDKCYALIAPAREYKEIPSYTSYLTAIRDLYAVWLPDFVAHNDQ